MGNRICIMKISYTLTFYKEKESASELIDFFIKNPTVAVQDLYKKNILQKLWIWGKSGIFLEYMKVLVLCPIKLII